MPLVCCQRTSRCQSIAIRDEMDGSWYDIRCLSDYARCYVSIIFEHEYSSLKKSENPKSRFCIRLKILRLLIEGRNEGINKSYQEFYLTLWHILPSKRKAEDWICNHKLLIFVLTKTFVFKEVVSGRILQMLRSAPFFNCSYSFRLEPYASLFRKGKQHKESTQNADSPDASPNTLGSRLRRTSSLPEVPIKYYNYDAKMTKFQKVGWIIGKEKYSL